MAKKRKPKGKKKEKKLSRKEKKEQEELEEWYERRVCLAMMAGYPEEYVWMFPEYDYASHLDEQGYYEAVSLGLIDEDPERPVPREESFTRSNLYRNDPEEGDFEDINDEDLPF